MTPSHPASVPATGSLNRHRERGRDSLVDLHALLDDVPWGVAATVVEDVPWQVPMLCARWGDRVLLHGSTGAGLLRAVGAGSPVSLCVTAIDGWVLAHSTFDHSANYRSAVITGRAVRLTGEEQAEALDRLTDRMVPGRTAEVRPTTPKEWAATTVLALPIEDGSWVMKVRTGGPGETAESHDVWRGVVPMHTAYADPVPAVDSPDRPLPDSVRALLGR